MNPKVITGSCMCGAVHFETRGELRPICLCHCTMCRKVSGHYTASTGVKTDKLTISGGSLTWFNASDYAEWGFCNKCGSTLFFRPFKKDRTSIFAGCIDSTIGLKTDSQIWIEDKGEYYELPDVRTIQQSDLDNI